MLALGMNASAQDVVFDFTPTDSYTMFGLTGTSNEGNEGDITETKTVEIDGVTFTITPSTTNTANRFWFYKEKNEIRMYSGTVTISSAKEITKIVFTTGTKNALSTCSTGTIADKEWTATEATNSVEFGVSGRTDLQTITVTVAGGSVDPEPQPTEPIVILEESFASSLGQFTTEENTLWSWESNTAKMQGNGVERTEPSYLISPVINVAEQGTISFSHYKNWDWTYNMNTKAGLYIRTVNGTWTSIEGVEYPTENKDFGGKAVDVLVNIPAEYGNKDIQIALGYKCAAGDQTTWHISNFVVKGIPGTAEPVDPQPTETIAENIAVFNALCVKDGVDVTLKLVDAQVLYVNQYVDKKGNEKQEVFVRDASGSVMFYNAGLTVKAGDVMNGEVKGSAKDFFGTKEFCTNAETDLAAIVITDGEAIAMEKAITEIVETEVSNLVLVRDVTMISKEEEDNKGNMRTNYYLVDANGNELAYYNKFHIDGLDASLFIEKESHIFVGIITLNYGKLQLCPTEQPVATSIDCIENVTLDVNAPMFNVAGQKVNANYKGIILQNGKKFINK